MIRDHDRSGWFGASDTHLIMGSWDTKTFANWWLVKLGIRQQHFENLQMMTGTVLEHRILEHLGIRRMDRQIRIPRLRLRVNLDGEDCRKITEVKTHYKTFRVTLPYWMQAQVEMFAARKPVRIAAYQVTEEDYRNYFLPIDPRRITFHPIQRDDRWLEERYLPRLLYLRDCLVEGRWPRDGAAV